MVWVKQLAQSTHLVSISYHSSAFAQGERSDGTKVIHLGFVFRSASHFLDLCPLHLVSPPLALNKNGM